MPRRRCVGGARCEVLQPRSVLSGACCGGPGRSYLGQHQRRGVGSRQALQGMLLRRGVCECQSVPGAARHVDGWNGKSAVHSRIAASPRVHVRFSCSWAHATRDDGPPNTGLPARLRRPPRAHLRFRRVPRALVRRAGGDRGDHPSAGRGLAGVGRAVSGVCVQRAGVPGCCGRAGRGAGGWVGAAGPSAAGRAAHNADVELPRWLPLPHRRAGVHVPRALPDCPALFGGQLLQHACAQHAVREECSHGVAGERWVELFVFGCGEHLGFQGEAGD
mmetsp:Transcript_39377/g.103088  ORF Transcript_39377/g.103088 Transcript_39377/m.103088 type:complete len:275 (+) Transcript_39377:164-988(+)